MAATLLPQDCVLLGSKEPEGHELEPDFIMLRYVQQHCLPHVVLGEATQ